MEHADTAQLAAVGGALGAVLVLLARGRVTLLAGLVLLAAAEAGLALSLGTGPLERLTSAGGAAAGAVGLVALGGAAALLARHPALVPIAVLLAAPFRPPIQFDTASEFLVSIADDGRLGRLLPLYFVLLAAVLALAWRTVRGRPVRALPTAIAYPAAAFFAFALLSLLWADNVEGGANLLTFFTLPFAALLGTVARADYPDFVPRALAAVALGLAALFALVGLWQAITRDLLFYAPNLAVSNANSDYFRVTSLFGDPSLYGRHVVLGIGVALALLVTQRWRTLPLIALVVLMWAGLLFSYSQSSMAALLVVTLALAFAVGDRRVRRAVGLLGLLAVLAAGAYVAVRMIDGADLNRITSDRTERVEDTARVIEERPVAGVGIGGQPRASRELAGSDRPTPTFVSHTTPLTVAAELGAIGLALYVWLLAGGVLLIARVRDRDEALGLALGASFLALFVHSLFYSGFLEDPVTWLVLAVAAGLADLAGGAHDGRGAREGASGGGMRDDQLGPLGSWALVGVLFFLVAITLPELGSDPWRFRPGDVEPQGPLAPLVRAAGEEWDLGIPRASAFLAALLCGAGAVWLLARPGGMSRNVAIGLVVAVGLLLAAPATLLQLGLRDSTAPWFFTNDSTYQAELGGELLLELDNPYGHDYRESGLERFYTRDGSVSERVREREVALEHFAYFPGAVASAALWRLLPEPFDDYRLLMLLCTLAMLPAALAFRGPLAARAGAGRAAGVQPDRGALRVVRPERRAQPAAARARLRAGIAAALCLGGRRAGRGGPAEAVRAGRRAVPGADDRA